MDTGSILRAAAARVRQGWCQDDFTDSQGGVCVMGALLQVGADGKERESVYEAINRALGVWDVATWNDADDQTQEGVAQGLERAAAWWDAQQVPAVVWQHRDKELVGA